MNLIENFKEFQTSENQIKAIKEKKLNANEIQNINNERSTLAFSIKNAAEFNETEKQDLFEKLINNIDDTNISEIRNYKIKIEQKQREIRNMINTYTGLINKNKNLFVEKNTNKLNSAETYIEQFIKLDESQKREWLNMLESDITEKLEMFKRAKELFPNDEDYIKTLGNDKFKSLKSELEKSKSYIKEAEKILKDNDKIFSKNEIKKIKEKLEDSTRYDQAKIINSIQGELKERKKLYEDFKIIPKKYQSMVSKFEELSLEEKKIKIEQIDYLLIEEYRSIQTNHPLNKHISETGKQEAHRYFITCSVKDKISALKLIDSQFKYEKLLSDEFEKSLKILEDTETKNKIDRLRFNFYKSDFIQKKEVLIPSIKSLIKINEKTKEEEKTLSETYKEKLESAVKNKHISVKTRNKILEDWNEKLFEDKKNAFKNLEKELKPYTELFKRFTKLPEKKQNTDFYNQTFHKKLELINLIEKQILEEEKNEKESIKDKKNIKKQEIKETINKENIQNLTTIATSLERENRYEEALKNYDEILKLDNKDTIALSRIKEIKEKLKEKTEEEDKIQKEIISEALKSKEIKEDQKDISIIQNLAKETILSEKIHGTIEASKKQKDSSNKEIAEKLKKYSKDKFVLNNKGEAEKIIELNSENSEINKENINKLHFQQKEKSTDTPMKNIQFKNNKGEKQSGHAGLKLADKIRNTLTKKIEKKAVSIAQKRKINIEKETFKESIKSNNI